MAVRSGTPMSGRDLPPLADSPFSRVVHDADIDAARCAKVEPPVVHRDATLDDWGGFETGSRVGVSGCVNVYSHTHGVDDIRRISLVKTVIADHANLACDGIVLAASRVGQDGMVSAMAGTTRSVAWMHVGVGIPARPIRPKARPCPCREPEGRGAAELERSGT